MPEMYAPSRTMQRQICHVAVMIVINNNNDDETAYLRRDNRGLIVGRGRISVRHCVQTGTGADSA